MFRVGLDIDGCINDFSNLIYKYATVFNEGHGINKSFDMSDYLIERYFGWTESMNNEFWAKFYKQALMSTFPLQGAVQTISLLKRNNIEIYIVTARNERYRELTVEWLRKHNIGFDKLIMSRQKAEICIDNDIELMVEDESENCSAIAKYIPVICMSYKYNENLEGAKNIKRVTNWPEIYNEIIHCMKEKDVV